MMGSDRACVYHKKERYTDIRSRRYAKVEVDAVIVGLGAAGGVLLKELAETGLTVVGIEAGPFWDPASDFASDELHARTLAWNGYPSFHWRRSNRVWL